MGLEQVIGEVRRDGDARAQGILDGARREAKLILDQARQQAQAYETQRMAAAAKDAAAASAQVASRAESEARKALLAAESDLRAQLRAALVKALAELPLKQREAHLKALLAQAQKVIPAGKVWGSAQDTTFLHTQKAYKHAGATAIAGGIVVESEDGMNRLDLSYETLLDEAWRDILKAEARLFA
ncbi:MAG: V/A-type H+/Na+-transporting ATPase subunit [Thermoplasmata archaeon]|jgi:vacuolar-type H+-ATPase subunit E/Vma4|nr:V/A-type H+/Na+-transporting ATPase subunit [Thermoplasmata archaeon]